MAYNKQNLECLLIYIYNRAATFKKEFFYRNLNGGEHRFNKF